MGFYFRKSKSVGPIRFNFSKSGIGVSTGIKGARLSFGPRGTYINVGRNGIYYKKKIGSSTKKGNNGVNKNTGLYHNNYVYQDIDATTDAIRIPTSSGQMTESGLEIIKGIRRAQVTTLVWWILLVVLLTHIGGWSILVMGVLRVIFHDFFQTEIDYEIDEPTKEKWSTVVDGFNVLRKSKKIWIVETSKLSLNAKINAGATHLLQRGDAKAKIIKANRYNGMKVKTGVPSFLISSKKCKIMFLPSEVLIKKGLKIVAFAYGDINIICSTTNFIEVGTVPRDAEITHYTWQYVNKNGTADKRFNNNCQLPVCRYGLLRLSAGNMLNIELHISNNTITDKIGMICKSYTRFLLNDNRAETGMMSPADSWSHNVSKTQYDTMTKEENNFLTELNDIGKEIAVGELINVLESDMGCKVTFIDLSYYQRHYLALYQTSKPVLDKVAIVEMKLNEYIKNANFDFSMISDSLFLVHIYMISPECIQTFDEFERLGIITCLSPVLRDALYNADEWAKYNKVPTLYSDEGIPNELFNNEVVQTRGSGKNLMDEFSEFVEFEED